MATPDLKLSTGSDEESLPMAQRKVRQEATPTTYTMMAMDDDDDNEQDDGPCMAHTWTDQSLSAMFENNDLINNRIAGLAESIRSGTLPPSRRRSLLMCQEVCLPAVGEDVGPRSHEDSGSATSSSEHSDDQKRTAVQDGKRMLSKIKSVQDGAADAPAQDKPLSVEERLRMLEEENAALRQCLDAKESAANPSNVSDPEDQEDASRQILRSFNPADRLASPAQPEAESSKAKTAWTKAATLISKDQRRKQRNERSAAHRQLYLESQGLTSGMQVEQCESIVDGLLDTIEALRASVRGCATEEAAAASSSAADEDVPPASTDADGDSYISELRGAIGDFFSGCQSLAAESGLTASDEATPVAEEPPKDVSKYWKRPTREKIKSALKKDKIMHFQK